MRDNHVISGRHVLVHPTGRYLAASVRAFTELTIEAAQRWAWEQPQR